MINPVICDCRYVLGLTESGALSDKLPSVEIHLTGSIDTPKMHELKVDITDISTWEECIASSSWSPVVTEYTAPPDPRPTAEIQHEEAA
eukprot:SAG22_NODE_12717_length_432_cov_0.609610_2_plen_88_part_01